MRIGVLVLYVHDGKILLCKKWAGAKIGANKWNSYGGEVEVGEGLRGAAVRETYKESGGGLSVHVEHLIPRGDITFYDWRGNPLWEVHLFVCNEFAGDPLESKEMKQPTWFDLAEIPNLDMLPADKIFMPIILKGETISKGRVMFNKDMTGVEGSFLPTGDTAEEIYKTVMSI